MRKIPPSDLDSITWKEEYRAVGQLPREKPRYEDYSRLKSWMENVYPGDGEFLAAGMMGPLVVGIRA